MRSVALLPSIAILTGTWLGIAWARDLPYASLVLVCLGVLAAAAWMRSMSTIALAATFSAYTLAGVMLGAVSARDALDPSLRSVLDAAYGGFALDTMGPPGPHGPITMRARLVEDASPRDFGVVLTARAECVTVDRECRRASGVVRLTVAGTVAAERATNWRAGRLIEAPVTFRRPARYLNDGVADFERDLALDGIALTGGVKSSLLVQVVEQGGRSQEAAAAVRAHVRTAVARRIGIHDPVAAGIVTAILIGDRTALPDEIRDRLQAAGTYHVIAISGGNIAILAALMAAILLPVGATGRTSALAIIGGLAAYGLVVSAGPSVWRATTMAIVYFGARIGDHRSPPWNAMAVSAAVVACVTPLDTRDIGFALTFCATAAILEAARRAGIHRNALTTWLVASVVASTAVEVVLLPISATAFSRVTVAGVVLNLLAVPLMTITQVAGLAVVILDRLDALGGAAGMVAAYAARGLVQSARLVEILPWLAMRVPPPSAVLVVAYYLALGSALWLRRCRRAAIAALAVCTLGVLGGFTALVHREDLSGRLRLDVFDVGQGEAMLLQLPGGRTVMVDAGGAGFDGTAFDIGGRVLAPALWTRGVTQLSTLAITHADPDHIGGALALVRDFAPREIWAGIPVPRHLPSQALETVASTSGIAIAQRRAGWVSREQGVDLRVLHPPAPDWERRRVRNDDSIVMEVRHGDVAVLLTGDISADVERTLLPLLRPARIRILKVAHHGSRTSTSQALLDAWKPHIALISCGRGNRFGHPAPEVIQQLEAAGAQIYRTDRDGQITVDTDGRNLRIRTYVGGTR